MTLRTTGVRLIAETSQYKRDMRGAAKETRDFKDGIDDARTSGDRFGEGLAKVGKSSNSVVDQMRRTVSGLEDQIGAAERSVRSLAKAYADSGDSGIGKQLRAQQSQLRELKNVRSLLPDAEEIAAAGAGIGTKLIGGIRTTFTSASPGALGIGAIGLLMAPTIGAAVSAAVAGGIGAGGIASGIALVAKSPEVKEAGKDVGSNFMAGLETQASVFKGPVLDALQQLDDASDRFNKKIGNVFSNTSPAVHGLTQNLIHAGDALLDGLVAGSARSGPALSAFGRLIETVGASAGGFIDDVTRNADAGASAIDDLSHAMSYAVDTTGKLVQALGDLKSGTDFVDSYIDKGRQWVEDQSDLSEQLRGFGTNLDLTADGYKKGSAAAELYRQGLIGVKGSVNDYAAYQAKANAETTTATTALHTEMISADELKVAQEALTTAQKGLAASTNLIGSQANFAKLAGDSLKTTMDGLYGGAIRSTEANEKYESSWDALSDAVKKNKGTLDVHTAAGRSNRDALQDLLTTTGEMYVADIQAGVAVTAATKKHQDRIRAVKEEARRLGLNETATRDLITTYGRIPPTKTTELILDGVKEVVQKMYDLYVMQRALAEGRSIGSMENVLRKGNDNGPSKRYGGYYDGGWTGPGGEREPAGIVHGDEYVIKKKARRKIERSNPGLLDEMNATGQVPGYAGGGMVAPVDTSRRWPFHTTVAGTKIPTREQARALIVPSFSGGNWPSSPAAQRGDSGVWHKVVTLIRSTGPLSGSFGNAYRPGDPKWHGSGRAVDWMGYNQDALATFLANRHPLELIHRTKHRDYAYTRGRNKGSFNESLMNAHRNHIHIAMDDGGFRTLQPGMNLIPNGTGRPELIGGPTAMAAVAGAGQTINVTLQFSGPVGNRQDLENWVTGVVDRLKKGGRL